MAAAEPPALLSHRFTLELEFVLCLSNPQYLQYLASFHPHLLNKPATSRNQTQDGDTDADRFARYLKYLYTYWRTPRYVQYLTHPGATLRNLELLQQEQFRKDLIRPDVIARLFETNDPPPATTNGNNEQDSSAQPVPGGDAEHNSS